MNRVALLGWVNKIITDKPTSSSHLKSFVLGVAKGEKDGKWEYNKIVCNAWGDLAKQTIIQEKQKIYIQGRIDVNNYQKQDGTWVNSTVVTVLALMSAEEFKAKYGDKYDEPKKETPKPKVNVESEPTFEPGGGEIKVEDTPNDDPFGMGAYNIDVSDDDLPF